MKRKLIAVMAASIIAANAMTVLADEATETVAPEVTSESITEEAMDETMVEETEATDETMVEETEATDEAMVEETEATDETMVEETEATDETMVEETEATDEVLTENIPVYINEEEIDAKGCLTDDGVVMVPLRAVNEALGYMTNWEDGNLVVETEDNYISFVVGTNNYQIGTTMEDAVGLTGPFTLESAPVLMGDVTYVPASFYGSIVYDLDAVDYADNMIVIARDTAETEDSTEEDSVSDLPTDMTEYDSVSRLSTAVGFQVTSPTIPGNFTKSGYYMLGSTIAQVNYVDGDKTLTLRQTLGLEESLVPFRNTTAVIGDITGESVVYEESKTIYFDDNDVVAKGNEGLIYNLVWSDGNFTYSITTDGFGLTESEAVELIDTVK